MSFISLKKINFCLKKINRLRFLGHKKSKNLLKNDQIKENYTNFIIIY